MNTFTALPAQRAHDPANGDPRIRVGDRERENERRLLLPSAAVVRVAGLGVGVRWWRCGVVFVAGRAGCP